MVVGGHTEILVACAGHVKVCLIYGMEEEILVYGVWCLYSETGLWIKHPRSYGGPNPNTSPESHPTVGVALFVAKGL